MSLMMIVIWCVVLLACVGAILWAYMNVRARRLVGLSFKPVYSIPRRGMEVSAPIAHSADGSVVEVRLAYGEHRYEVAVERLTYNGLVSWVESGPPRLV